MRPTARSHSRPRRRGNLFSAVIAGVLLALVLPAATALADAPDPVDTTMQGSFVTNGDGTHTLTLNGTWQWPRDCGQRQVGWEVDWNDPDQPGNIVATKNGVTTDVGVLTGNSRNPADNMVDTLGPGNCNPTDPTTGVWGPISHTYAANITEVTACVVMYDETIPPANKGSHSAIAGGPDHNTDNSLEKNYISSESGCFPQTFTVEDPEIRLDKSGPSTAQRGTTITYDFDVSVPSGGEPLHDVTLTDTKCDPGTISGPVKGVGDADTLLEPNEVWSYTCTHFITQSDPSELINVATASGKSPSNTTVTDTDDHTVMVYDAPFPTIAIDKTGPATAERGETITYNFRVYIPSGAVPLTNIWVTDDRCDAGTWTGPDKTNGNTDNTLEAGEEWLYSCQHLVTPTDPDPLPNEAEVEGDGPNGEHVEADDYWTVDITDQPPGGPDLSIIKSDNMDPIPAGGDLVYTILVTNNGPGTATDVTVTDTIQHSSWRLWSPPTTTQGSCSPADPQTGDVITCQLGTLTAGQSATITLHVKPKLCMQMINTAIVSAFEQDPNPANNSATETTQIDGMCADDPDMSVVTTANPKTGTVGETLTYDFLINQGGPEHGTGITVWSKLDKKTIFVSAVATQGACSEEDLTVECELGEMAVGDQAHVEIVVIPKSAGTITNRADVDSNEYDEFQNNNTFFLDTKVKAPADAESFVTSGDATVYRSDPSKSGGMTKSLEVGSGKRALLKFNIKGIGHKSISSATLRLYGLGKAANGGRLHTMTDSSWSERSVTWSKAPSFSPTAAATIGTLGSRGWVDIDVTDLVAGDGSVSFTITGKAAAKYASGQAASKLRPRLVIQTGKAASRYI